MAIYSTTTTATDISTLHLWTRISRVPRWRDPGSPSTRSFTSAPRV